MQPLAAIPPRHHHAGRRAASTRPWRRARGAVEEHNGAFTPLIDATAAGRLLGVPYTWLLAQARAGRIPHHRLGHYVRFSGDDLARWLEETREGPLRAGEAGDDPGWKAGRRGRQPRTLGDGMRAAIDNVKRGYEAMIDSWRRQ